MTTLRTTIQNLKQYYKRRILLEANHHFLNKLAVFTKPGMVGVICYRFSHYFAQTKFRYLCRLLLFIEHFYSRNEISPYAYIGPGLVLGDVGAIGVPYGTEIGKNCTFLGFNTFALNAINGIDYTVDKIVMGDHCVLGIRAKVMRAITIADGAQVKENSVVMFSVSKKGTTLSGVPAKRRRVDAYENIIQWNPFNGCHLDQG